MPTSTPDAPLQLPQGILGLRSRRSIPPSERFREDTTEPESMDAVAADSNTRTATGSGSRRSSNRGLISTVGSSSRSPLRSWDGRRWPR
jgi:hypothetical protein